MMLSRALIRRAAATATATATARANVQSASATRGLRVLAAAATAVESAASAVRMAAVHAAGACGVKWTAQAAPLALSSRIDGKEFVPLKLAKCERHNHDTDLYTFALPNRVTDIDLPVCYYVEVKFTGADGKPVVRRYNPIQRQKGALTLLVKHYEKGVMSQHMAALNIGDTLDFKGPFPTLLYEPNKWKEIGMVAGGTGITPCLQVMDAILSNPFDKTRIHLAYANKTDADILMGERLDYVSHWDRMPFGRVRVWHMVSKADLARRKAATGRSVFSRGFEKSVLRTFLPKPSDHSLVIVCGPPSLVNEVCGDKAEDGSQGEITGTLKELGFDKTNVYKF